MRSLIFTGILLLYYQLTLADSEIYQFNVEDGLSQSTVQSITSDIFGYVWASTGDGLNCYDGHTFSRFYPDTRIISSSQSSSIRHIISDSIGNLWVGTDRGLLYFNRANTSFEIPFPDITDLKTQACLPLYLTNDSLYVMVASKGMLSINVNDYKFRRRPFPYMLGGLNVYDITDNEKWLILGPGSLLKMEFQPNGRIRTFVYNVGESSPESIKTVCSIGNNQRLITTTRALFVVDLRGNMRRVGVESLDFLPDNTRLQFSITDQPGRIWLITANHGVYLLDFSLQLIEHQNSITSNEDKPVQTDGIISGYLDKKGNVWLGTDGNGLLLVSHQKKRFNLVSQFESDGNKVIPFVRCFLQTDTTSLWVGTYNSGLVYWDRSSGIFESFKPAPKTGLSRQNDICSLARLDQDHLLAGSSDGLWVFDINSKKFSPVHLDIDRYSIFKFSCIKPFGDQLYLTLLNGSFYRLSKTVKNWELELTDFPPNYYYEHFKVIQEAIYLFNQTGVFVQFEDSISFYPFIFNKLQMDLKVNEVVRNQSGDFWLATHTGLVKTDSTFHILRIYNENDGLANHFIYGIVKDKKGNLWISTNRGISMFDPGSEKFTNFGLEDGLQSLEFNSGAYYESTNHEIFFGGIHGFNYFYPDDITFSQSLPGIFITSLEVNDKPLVTDTCPMAKTVLSLPYSGNTITIGFSELDFGFGGKYSYYYMLEGHDPDWINGGDASKVRYSRLYPGEYNFKVIAVHSDDFDQNRAAVLRIYIARPFWMRSIFILSAGFLLMALIILSVRYFATRRMKRKIADLERAQEIAVIRRKISSDLHDDIGSGLSKLAMISDTAMQDVDDKAETKNRLSRIASEARQMTDQLRVIVWALNPADDQLEGLLSYIRQQTGEYLDEFDIDYQLQVPEVIPAITISAEFKRNIFYTVREAVHNAVKYAHSDRLHILVEIDQMRLKVTIEDYGKGFDQDQAAGKGNGLRIMHRRIEDLGGKTEIITVKGRGTRVIISVPF